MYSKALLAMGGDHAAYCPRPSPVVPCQEHLPRRRLNAVAAERGGGGRRAGSQIQISMGSSTRPATPSLRYTRVRCCSTVLTVMNSLLEIWQLV